MKFIQFTSILIVFTTFSVALAETTTQAPSDVLENESNIQPIVTVVPNVDDQMTEEDQIFIGSEIVTEKVPFEAVQVAEEVSDNQQETPVDTRNSAEQEPETGLPPLPPPMQPFAQPSPHSMMPQNRPMHQFIPVMPPNMYPLIRPPFFARHEPRNEPRQPQTPVACSPDTKRSANINFERFQQFFMSPKNHDVMFSVCGDLMPAHRVIIEASSPLMAKVVEFVQKSDPQVPIEINSFEAFMALINGDGPLRSDLSKCPQNELSETFKILLKIFYVGDKALDDLSSVSSALLLWNMAKPVLSESNSIEHVLQDRVGELMGLDDISTVYRFAKQHNAANLNKVWKTFLHQNRVQIITENSTRLPIDCQDANVEFLDHYIDSLQVGQAQALVYIGHFMNTCSNVAEEVAALQMEKKNVFPHSIQLFRCNVQDLRELVNLRFISYQHFADELEQRLRSAERQLETVRMNGIPPQHRAQQPVSQQQPPPPASDLLPSPSQNIRHFLRLPSISNMSRQQQ